GLHEPELVGAVRAAEKALGMHEDALAAVLLRAYRDELALAHAARLGHDEIPARVQHDDAVHTRQPRPAPRAPSANVGGEVGRREEPVWQHAVGGRGLETGVGRPGERRRREVGGAVLEPRTGRHRSGKVMRNVEFGMRNRHTTYRSTVALPFRNPQSAFRITRASPDPDRPPLPAPVRPGRALRDRWRAAPSPSRARASATAP